MRYLVTATMAASVLAIGLEIAPAQSLPLGSEAAAGADTAILKVQREGKGGGGGPGAGGGAGQGGPAAREGGGGGGGGAMRGGGGTREGGGMRQGGAQLRSGERGTRSEGSAQFRSERGTRGTRGERGVEFGYRDRDRRHGRRDGGVFIERGYGYAPGGGCGWLRQRALATDSPYWWRRYRACRGL